MKKILSALLAFAFLFSGALSAQDDEGGKKRKKVSGGTGYFAVGWTQTDIGDLNTILTTAGYQGMEDNAVTLGGGGLAFINSFVIGGEGVSLLKQSKTSNGTSMELTGGAGFFKLGYVAFSGKGFIVFPTVGIGGGGMSLFLHPNADSAVTFTNAVQNPRREVMLDQGGFMGEVALNAFFVPKADEYSMGGFVLGICGGYRFAKGQDNWEMNHATLGGSPDSGLTGAFVRLTIGGGGFARK